MSQIFYDILPSSFTLENNEEKRTNNFSKDFPL